MATQMRATLALGASVVLVLTILTFFGDTGSAQPAAPIVRSEFGVIRSMEAGWSQDTMAVQHSAPVVNPGGCRLTDAGYATSPADDGHDLFHTVLLSAFLNRKEVALLVSGCVYDKPHIISVTIR
jgi:hypothetical protein